MQRAFDRLCRVADRHEFRVCATKMGVAIGSSNMHREGNLPDDSQADFNRDAAYSSHRTLRAGVPLT